METEYPMPLTFQESIFWLEIAGYKIIARSRSGNMVQLQAPNNDLFECSYQKAIQAAKRVWRQFYNVSEVRAYNP